MIDTVDIVPLFACFNIYKIDFCIMSLTLIRALVLGQI